MVHGRVVETFVRIDCLARDFTRDGKRPAINLPHITFSYLVALRIEVREVSQRISGRVAKLAIGVNHAIQNLGRNSYVFLIVRGRSPQSQYLRALFADDLVRRDRVARGLVHGLAFAVYRPAVSDHRFVRRLVARGQANHQRRVEPAAMLIRTLDVDVSRPRHVPLRNEHGDG